VQRSSSHVGFVQGEAKIKVLYYSLAYLLAEVCEAALYEMISLVD